MNQEKKGHQGVSIIGIILVLLGIVWVLNNIDVIDFSFGLYWPVILIAVGVINLVGIRRFYHPAAWILIAVGVIFLLTTHDVLEWGDVWKFWPVILIIIGLSILFKRQSIGFGRSVADERINETAIFWGFEQKVTSKKFKGGSITAIFGGGDLDLRDAELDAAGAVIDITAIFGGVEIKLPESWVVEAHTTGIFGGAENKCKNPEKHEGKRIVINATAIFGGIDIKN